MPMSHPLREAVDTLRAFAFKLPGAKEEHPWGESVAKVNKKVFVFFGRGAEAGECLGFSVKLPTSHRYALTQPYTEPTGYGLGKSGWVTVRYQLKAAPPLDLFADWIEESYRAVAPKKLIAKLDAPAEEAPPPKRKKK